MTLTIPSLVAPEVIFCVVPAKTKANAVGAMLAGPCRRRARPRFAHPAGSDTVAGRDSASLL
jgi:6-phosphogluconolactonase/glucosamine-6-phosphate isomerase/deaminase